MALSSYFLFFRYNGSSVFLMSNVKCSGLESSVVECDHSGWGPLNCTDGLAVYLTCQETALHKVQTISGS